MMECDLMKRKARFVDSKAMCCILRTLVSSGGKSQRCPTFRFRKVLPLKTASSIQSQSSGSFP